MCQLFNLECQCAKVVPSCHFSNLACKQSANFSFWWPNFQTFFLRNTKGKFYTLLLHKKVLHYTSCHMEMQLCSRFANFKNIWAILENLSRETKNLNFGICKLSLRKNLLKSLTSFSMEHVRLTEQLFS